MVYSGQETVIVPYLADVYHLDAYKAGLAFIAAIVPTLISMPCTGYFSDKYGPEWVSPLSLSLGIPWWGAITLKGSLVQFLAICSFESEITPSSASFQLPYRWAWFVALFTSGLVSPLMYELATVSQSIQGVGCECRIYLPMTSFSLTVRGVLPDAHVYGSFNLAIGIGGPTSYFSRVLPLTISHDRLQWYAPTDKPLRQPKLMFTPQSAQSFVARFIIRPATHGRSFH